MNQDSPLGVISERDYARNLILKNRSSHDTHVADIMGWPVITLGPNDTIHHGMA
jgi:predicted transcriptional regulator